MALYPRFEVKIYGPTKEATEPFHRRKFALSYARKLWKWRTETNSIGETIRKIEVFQFINEFTFDKIATHCEETVGTN